MEEIANFSEVFEVVFSFKARPYLRIFNLFLRIFGQDRKCRIHTGEGSARSARALNALAYTVGNNIIFETGRYEPYRPEGMKLLDS